MLFSPYRKCPNSKKASKSKSRRLFVFLSSPSSTAPMLITVGDHQFKIVGCVPHCPNFRMLTFLKLYLQFQQRSNARFAFSDTFCKVLLRDRLQQLRSVAPTQLVTIMPVLCFQILMQSFFHSSDSRRCCVTCFGLRFLVRPITGQLVQPFHIKRPFVVLNHQDRVH